MRRGGASRLELGDGVLLLQNVEERVNVQVGESAVGREGVGVVAYIEFLVEEPHISLNADTAGMDGFVERDFAPVVVVRMAGDGFDVAGEISGPVREALRRLSRVSPVLENPVDVVGEEGHEGAESYGQKLNNAAGGVGQQTGSAGDQRGMFTAR